MSNYTTKTAWLKAVNADIRKVTANTVYVDHTVEKDGAEVTESVDVVSLIKDAQDSAAISVGRDADKNWSVDEESIDMVKKISFLGDYVNVVKGTNGEVKLYIGENKSLPEANKNALDGSYPATSKVFLYTHATDNFTLPVAADNKSTYDAVLVKDDSSWSDSKFTAISTTGTECFTLDSNDFIWVRTSYEGVATPWGKVSLKKDRGAYNDGGTDATKSSVTKVAFVADSIYSETAPSNITMKVGNHVLTAENDAKNGKVPGRCETAFDFTVKWNDILTKDGGKVKVEWCIGGANSEGTAPATGVAINSKELFFTEYKDAEMEAGTFTAVLKEPAYSDKVSGLTYYT